MRSYLLNQFLFGFIILKIILTPSVVLQMTIQLTLTSLKSKLWERNGWSYIAPQKLKNLWINILRMLLSL